MFSYDLDALQRQLDQMKNQMAQNPMAQPVAPTVRSPPYDTNIIWAMGPEGAKGTQTKPDSNVWMLDSENEGIFYIKCTDAVGMSKMRKFRFTEEPMEDKQDKPLTREDVQQIILEMLGKGNHDETVSGTCWIKNADPAPGQ